MTEKEIPGLAFQHVFRMDADPNECFLVIGFTTKEAYHANAVSPEQEVRTAKSTELIDGPSEWHDGEIISERTCKKRSPALASSNFPTSYPGAKPKVLFSAENLPCLPAGIFRAPSP